jgi:hypothetical protein
MMTVGERRYNFVMEWHNTIESITPHVVRITTPQGSGTGWVVSLSRTSSLCAVATAAHVVNHAHFWEQPLRIHHASSGQSVLLREADRAVYLNEKLDTAGIIFYRGTLPVPAETLPLMTEGMYVKSGVEIGWLGFPAVAASDLCFFSGRISAYLKRDETYLVDGVAINGVSGGPAFQPLAESVRVIGVISAYIPNRATGEVLPGVSVVRDVTQFQDLTKGFKSFDDAKAMETPADEPPPPVPEIPPATS